MSIPWLEVGTILQLGEHLFTRKEIIDFARKFDPQPFHLSDEGVAGTYFERLAASGWHTASVAMRKLVDARQRQQREAAENGVILPKFGPSPGITNLKWSKPVYVDDVIGFTSTVAERRESRSRAGLVVMKSRLVGLNQDGEQVIEFTGASMIQYA